MILCVSSPSPSPCVYFTDEQVPEFTFCPSDFSRNTTLGQSTSASVVWTEPTATDNDPSLNLTSDVEQPATLPYGSNLVTYMARDRAGNKVNCSFTVTVIGELPQEPHDRCSANQWDLADRL